MVKTLEAKKKFPFTSINLAQSRVLAQLATKYMLAGKKSEAKAAYKLLQSINVSDEKVKALDDLAFRLDLPALNTSWPEPLLKDLCRKAALGDIEGANTTLME
mmetsp:Transcript_9771/g.19174  ORF Transcript_9771/g.19174 Transcript_9771/m.19174 type:complete len:103 (+) Transcript_9771:1287-1595(+)